MIPRINRLPSVRLHGANTIPTPLFIVKVAKNNFSYSRMAFVVSKKVDKRAVVRNRLKRLLRESVFRQAQHLSESKDMIFIIKKNFLDLSSQELETLVQDVFLKIEKQI